MKIEFVTADVFTAESFGGNPVAVIPDAAGLNTEQMQNLAMEFNLSETTFVLPPKDSTNTAKVRIFTPKAEIPFAGHPNIGTAFVLSRIGWPGERFVFEEQAGLVAIELHRENGKVTGARLAAPQAFQRGDDVSATAVAEACSLSPDNIESANHSPCLASCGMGFVFAELKSREALASAVPRTDVFNSHFPATQTSGIQLYTRTEEDDIDIEGRVFAPLHGVYEDPATGSANVALVGLLASIAPQPDLDFSQVIRQGVDMGRPSFLTAEAEKRGGEVETTRIGGDCVWMSRGAIKLP